MMMTSLVLAAAGWEGCLFVILAPLAALCALIIFAMNSSGRRKNLEAVATRLGGTLVPGFIGGNQVEFQVQGTPGRLACYSGDRSQPAFTRLQLDVTPRGRLRIFPEGLFGSLRKAFGAQDIEIGDARFDTEYVIQGSPETWVREILDPETRRRIYVITSLGESFLNGNAFTMEAGSTGLTISCGRNLADDPELLQGFLDNALALHARIVGRHAPEIQILRAEENATRGNCPVCANPLEGEARQCPKCATPHHADCWEYFGGCAIYGCGSKGDPRGR
jgi:hypothetical protein